MVNVAAAAGRRVSCGAVATGAGGLGGASRGVGLPVRPSTVAAYRAAQRRRSGPGKGRANCPIRGALTAAAESDAGMPVVGGGVVAELGEVGTPTGAGSRGEAAAAGSPSSAGKRREWGSRGEAIVYHDSSAPPSSWAPGVAERFGHRDWGAGRTRNSAAFCILRNAEGAACPKRREASARWASRTVVGTCGDRGKTTGGRATRVSVGRARRGLEPAATGTGDRSAASTFRLRAHSVIRAADHVKPTTWRTPHTVAVRRGGQRRT